MVAAVRPLCYIVSPLNHRAKSNQIWCVNYSHELGVQQHIFGPVSWGPGEGAKDQISLNFNYKVNFESVGICDGASSTTRTHDLNRYESIHKLLGNLGLIVGYSTSQKKKNKTKILMTNCSLTKNCCKMSAPR